MEIIICKKKKENRFINYSLHIINHSSMMHPISSTPPTKKKEKTYLTSVHVDTESGPEDGFIQVFNVIKDNVGGLTAQFQGNLLQVGFGSSLHDQTTNGSGTSESNLRNLVVTGKKVTSNMAITSDNVNNTRGWVKINKIKNLVLFINVY